MIPKTIHYCWFGSGQMPSIAKKCILSWEKVLPEYSIKLWNEESFDITCNTYVQEAYQARKFAFVTDYVRLYALFNEGGIYMDTDVEVIKPLDTFLTLPAFSGFESDSGCITGIMGSEKHGAWVKDLLEEYSNRHFIRPDGSIDMMTNVLYTNNLMIKKGLKLNGQTQQFENYVTIFAKEFFCPKSWDTDQYIISDKTHTIHHFAASWWTRRQKILRWIRKHVGERTAHCLAYFWRPPKVLFPALLVTFKSKVLGLSRS